MPLLNSACSRRFGGAGTSVSASQHCRANHLLCQATTHGRHASMRVVCMWTRPTPDRDTDWVKPSYVPPPSTSPVISPSRPEGQPLYAPSMPEFRPSEQPNRKTEMPEAPKMPERMRDPLPAGNPKEKPGQGGGDPDTKREAPPSKRESEAEPSK